MEEKEKIILKQELCETIINKCKGYGSDEQPLTIGIFKAIMKEICYDERNKLIRILENRKF